MKGRFTILGTSSAIPTKERNHPSVYLQYGSEALLFDCGEGTQRQIQLAELSFFKINRIFITHLHGDHVLGLPGLLQTLDFHEKEHIQIFGPKGLKELVELSTTRCFYINTEDLKVDVFEFDESNDLFEVYKGENYTVKGAFLNHTVPCIGFSFEENSRFKFDKEKIRKLGLKANHFKELENKGYTTIGGKVFKREELGSHQRGFKWVYITDTYYTENIFLLTEKADYVIIECTYFDEDDLALKVKHLSFNIFRERIYPVFQEQGVKKIILTHFSRRYKDLTPFEEAIKRYKMENVILAKDLLSFHF